MKPSNRSIFVVGLSIIALLSACSGSQSSSSVSTSSDTPSTSKTTSSVVTTSQTSLPTTLPDITGLAFDQETSVLSFNEVPGATSYDYVFKHGDEIVYSDTLESNVVDVEALGIAGNCSVTIVAKNSTCSSKPASLSFIALSRFAGAKIEAEDHLYNFGTGKQHSNFRNNPLASNGAYVGGTDDAGQGIYINYLSPFAGEFDIDAYYLCDFTNPVREPAITEAHHDVFINGVKQTSFIYTEQTGWGGATFNPAVSTTKITLVEGWNTISIMKNGTAADNWGDFAELDYVEIHGNGQQYNVDDLAKYGEAPSIFKLEAEMGSPRKKNAGGLYECKNPAEAGAKFSNGFLLGNMDNKYDGVEWHFYSNVKAEYSINLCYAGKMYNPELSIKPSFIVSQEAVGLQKNADFNKKTRIQPQNAFPFTSDWGVTAMGTETITVTLEAGDNFIYCLNYGDTSIFQIDYVDFSFVREVE